MSIASWVVEVTKLHIMVSFFFETCQSESLHYEVGFTSVE